MRANLGVASAALLAFLAAMFPSPAAQNEPEVHHADSPPVRKILRLKQVPGLGGMGDGASTWTGLAADRFGTIFYLRNLRNFLQIDPQGGAEKVAIRDLPEKFADAKIWTFSFGNDGNFHLFAESGGSERSWVITVDKKGRYERATPLPVSLLMASGAVGASGEILLSALLVPTLDPTAPAAPLLVYDKDGKFKKTLGRWLDPAKDPLVDAGSNARIVRLEPDGTIVLASRDRYRLEILRSDGELVRTITVEGAPPAETPQGEKAVEKPVKGAGEAPPKMNPAVESGIKGAETKKIAREIELEDVIRDVAFHDNRIYVLRAPSGSGQEASRPAIDVFDSNGKWEAQLLLEGGAGFSSLAIDPSGILYLSAPSGKAELLTGDLASASEEATSLKVETKPDTGRPPATPKTPKEP